MSHPLVGMWKLVGIEREGGEPGAGSGSAPSGCLLYTEQGWMSESLLLPVEDGEEPPRTVIYCGTYKLEGDSVIHQPLFHLDASQIGLDLPRGFEVAGDGRSFVLIASAARLHWERVNDERQK